MEQMLKSVPVDLRMTMEALVQDLSNALEESSNTDTVRRRWGLRRRARSTGNLPLSVRRAQSEDSSSSLGEPSLSHELGMSSLHQSDSDDFSPVTGIKKQLTPFNLQSQKVAHIHGNFESDSFNENFSPIHPNTRRKRKFKRMAVDPVEINNTPSTSRAMPMSPCIPVPCGKKKKAVKHLPNCENRLGTVTCGKRKRSMREHNMEVEKPVGMRYPHRLFSISKGQLIGPDESRMDIDESNRCELMSSSSLSSSESDTGIFTNDEGREGDDEQSDWFGGEAAGKVLLREEETDLEDDDNTFQAILKGSFELLSDEAKRAYRERINYLHQGLSGREIKGGRRRIRGNRPGFSILTSANEKLSKFLQDPDITELRLHPMKKQERDQLCHLANLYSLSMTNEYNKSGDACPILTKTRNTMQAVKVEQETLNRIHARLREFKRRKKALTNLSQAFKTVGNSAPPIPEGIHGSELLSQLSWEPGTELGIHNPGIEEPISAIIRPKRLGLGNKSS